MPEKRSSTIVDAVEVVPALRPFEWWELVYQLAMLAVAVVVLVFSFAMRFENGCVFLPGADFPLPESCTSRMLWGVDCPGCGLTRSFLLMSRGEWGEAARMNPAGPLAWWFAWFQIPWRLWQLGRMAHGRTPLFSVWLFVPLVMIWVVLVGQWWWSRGAVE